MKKATRGGSWWMTKIKTGKIYCPYMPIKSKYNEVIMSKVSTRVEIKILEVIAQFVVVFVCVYCCRLLIDPYILPAASSSSVTIWSSLFGTSVSVWVSPGFRRNVKYIWNWFADSKQSEPESVWDELQDANEDLINLLKAATKKNEDNAPITEKQKIAELKGNILDD